MTTLKFTILHFPGEGKNNFNKAMEYFIGDVNEKFKSTLEQNQDLLISIEPKVEKKKDFSLADKKVYLLIIKFPSTIDNLAQLILDIGKLWCDPNVKQDSLRIKYFHWLIPEVSEVKVPNLDKEQKNLKLLRFYFGSLVKANAFIAHSKVKYDDADPILFACQHHLQKFVVEFHQGTNHHYKITINYCDIHRLLVHDKANLIFFYFHLKVPAFLAIKKIYRNKIFWERVNCFGSESPALIGKSSVLKLCFPDKFSSKRVILRLIQFLSPNNKIVFCPVENVQFDPTPFPQEKFLKFQHFNSYYAWLCICGQNFQIQDQLIHSHKLDDVIGTMLNFEAQNEAALQKSLYVIFEAIYQGKIINFSKSLAAAFQFYCDTLFAEHIYEGLYKIPKAVFTPSRILFLPPQLQMQNSILRKYGGNHFLAISLREEDFSKLTGNVGHSPNYDSFMEKTYGTYLKNGIQIYNRRYEFLAASTSQLREHKLWMYASNNNISADSIRSWIGYSDIKGSASKKLARMGLFFSSTFDYLEITDDIQVRTEPDRTISNPNDPQNPYVFSDGIGMVSSSVAQKIRKKVDKFEGRADIICPYEPSGFQIRSQGHKGMLAENPKLEGNQIVFRKSMKKFIANTNFNLAFIKTTAPRAVFLNRQIITLLDQKGVPSNKLLQLQKEMIVKLVDPLIYDREAALSLTLNSSSKYPFEKLYEAGINLIEEPFFHSLLVAFLNETIDLLKTKARIAVPPEFGRNLMGVLDEAGKLGPGQVFVRYSEKIDKISRSDLKVLTGPVVVTKNPCIHPGDIRILTAVDEPELYHLIDCIVFPFNGLDRPITDEIGGGDLDGDEYSVFWHPDLLFDTNYPPMIYERLGAKGNISEPSVNDLIEFIFEYIKYDCLGMLSNSHLAFSDLKPDGIYSRKCLDIAMVYPASLDYAKSGIRPASMNDFRTEYYPDFMEKGYDKYSYASKRVLGDMFRDVKTLLNSIKCASYPDDNWSYDPLLEYPGWEKFEEKAEQRRSHYEYKLKQIFLQQGLVENEACLGGHSLKFLQYVDHQQREMEKQVMILMITMDYFQRNMQAQFEKDTHNMESEDRLRMASSWYMVAYKNHYKEGFLSFPWIIAYELIQVRDKMVKMNCILEFPKSTLLDKLNVPLKVIYEEKLKKGSFSISEFVEFILYEWVAKFEPTLNSSAVGNSVKQICLDLLNSEEEFDVSKLASLVMKVLENITLGKGSYFESETADKSVLKLIKELALKTYACLPITRNFSYLGLDFPQSHCTSTATYKEFPTLKVSVNADLRAYFRNSYIQIADTLREWTGIQELQLDSEETEKHRVSYNAMIVTVKATEIQYWNLKKILNHRRLSDALRLNDINLIKLD